MEKSQQKPEAQGLASCESENEPRWHIGDTCFLITSVQKRYAQKFTVQGFDGRYYTLKHGSYLHRAVPKRMFRTKEEACASLGKRKDTVQKAAPETAASKFSLRPALPEEAGLFYAMSPEENEKLGCIGHVRMDFGSSGSRLWHTWWPRGPEELNTPEFKSELDELVNELRKTVLHDLTAMEKYCFEHGGVIQDTWSKQYGYVTETEHYRYCLRCNPVRGDYQAYLTAFDKRVQAMNQTPEESIAPEQTFG